MGKGNVSLADCQKSTDLMDDGEIADVTNGNHLCMLTNQGRFVLLRIVSDTRITNNLITMHMYYVM
jgi:hypothetical protein